MSGFILAANDSLCSGWVVYGKYGEGPNGPGVSKPFFNLVPHFLLLSSLQGYGISQSLLVKLAPASIATLSHCLIWVSSTMVYMSV